MGTDVTWEPESNIDEQNPALVEYWAAQVPTLLSSPLLYSLLTTHYSLLTTHYSLLTTQLLKNKDAKAKAKALKDAKANAKAKNAMAKNATVTQEEDPGAGVWTLGEPQAGPHRRCVMVPQPGGGPLHDKIGPSTYAGGTIPGVDQLPSHVAVASTIDSLLGIPGGEAVARAAISMSGVLNLSQKATESASRLSTASVNPPDSSDAEDERPLLSVPPLPTSPPPPTPPHPSPTTTTPPTPQPTPPHLYPPCRR